MKARLEVSHGGGESVMLETRLQVPHGGRESVILETRLPVSHGKNHRRECSEVLQRWPQSDGGSGRK